MSAAAIPADEVALDFQDSLQDLQDNNRYEISNLTIIAKENTEHAQAISMVLEKHIRTTSPVRKLPALYVLDSIVKNVGTPYTVYLGRNLFSTFMDAYTLVNGNIRKNMEGMLKTWKAPVPGSLDPRPVFPPEVTRVIENALIKARTLAVQQEQQSRNQRTPLGMPPRPISSAFRNTPTPPQNGSRYPPPPQTQYQDALRNQQPTPQQFSNHQQIPDLARLLSASVNPQEQELSRLKGDIQSLITGFQSEFARNPFDTGVQSKLKALLDLQAVMASQALSPEAINLIKNQVAGLRAAQPQAQPSSTPSLLPPHLTSQWQPPTPAQQPFQPPPSITNSYAPPSSVQPPIPSLPNFAPGVLESLLASTANGQKPSTPALQAALPVLQNLASAVQSPRPAAATPAPASTGNPLIDALRAAGLVQGGAPSISTQNPTALPPPPSANATTSLLQQLQGLAPNLPPPPPPTLTHPSHPRISLTSPNLKLFRPDLLTSLYSALPNQCSTCGRRFPATDTGRSQKSLHLDWHFRTNQRIADASSQYSGLTRSYYVDEMEWITLHDTFDITIADAAATTPSTHVGGGGAKKEEKEFVRAPTGASAGKACPICQEKFETVWHEEAQEWVWMDARSVGGRILHASCQDEVMGGLATAQAQGQRGRSGTPDSGVLGKRKAEADLTGLKAKLKKEVAA